MRLSGKLMATLLGVSMAAGCGISHGRGRDPTGHPGRAAGVHVAALPHQLGSFRVGVSSVSLIEPASAASATMRTGAGTPARGLQTALLYPAAGAPDGGEHPGAPPDTAHGRYPLVVFSQGFDVSTASYEGLLDAWASAGYVVAAPTYPDTDPSAPGGPDEQDVVNHPSDLSYVLRSLVSKPPSAVGPILDPSEVAVVGQSDGGDVSLAVADNSCCRNNAVKAAAILSGAELAAFGGAYYRSKTVPLLVVQGNDDTINPPACSVQLYDQSPPPRYYLDLLGADHLPPYLNAGTDQTIVERATTDFLNGYLKGAGPSLARLARDGAAAGVATISASGQAPSVPGSCPGAP